MKNNKKSSPCVCVICFRPCQWDGEIQQVESDLDREMLAGVDEIPHTAEEFLELLVEISQCDSDDLSTEPPEHVRAIYNGPDPRYLSVWDKYGNYCYQYLPAGWEADPQ